jgi:hypothetical protein
MSNRCEEGLVVPFYCYSISVSREYVLSCKGDGGARFIHDLWCPANKSCTANKSCSRTTEDDSTQKKNIKNIWPKCTYMNRTCRYCSYNASDRIPSFGSIGADSIHTSTVTYLCKHTIFQSPPLIFKVNISNM